MVPATLLIIFVLLYLIFRRADEALLIMATLPLALVGGFWLLFLLGHHISVASAVGFIALAGVSAEFGVIMLLYLKHARDARLAGAKLHLGGAEDAIREGAVLRVRPKAMTVAVIVAGLLPIMSARYRLGDHAANRSTDGGRHDYRAAAVHVRSPGRIPLVAQAAPRTRGETHPARAPIIKQSEADINMLFNSK